MVLEVCVCVCVCVRVWNVYYAYNPYHIVCVCGGKGGGGGRRRMYTTPCIS